LLAALSAASPAADGAGIVATSSPSYARRWWLALGPLAAVAAALVLVVPCSPSPPQGFSAGYVLDPLPGSTSIRSHAAPSGETPEYVLDGRLRLVLRPENAVTHAVQVVAFGREPSGRVVRLAFEPMVDSSSGVMTLEGIVRDTGLTVGEWELVVVIGRPEALPSSWDELTRADAADDVIGYEVVRQRLNVVTTLTMH
jgi:hypothetical protein